MDALHCSFLSRLCTDLQTLIQERAEIEKAYAKSLKTWSKKWGDLIERGTQSICETTPENGQQLNSNAFALDFAGPEYGTMEAAWKGILTEAERLSDVHLQVKENLCCGEIKQIKTWQKENYHKVITPIGTVTPIRNVRAYSCTRVHTVDPFAEHDPDQGAQRNGGPIQEGAKTMGKTLGQS